MSAPRVTINERVVLAKARRASTGPRADIARRVVATHAATAPRVTGAYAKGAAVVAHGEQVTVINRDPDAVYKEYGTSDTPAHASMTNAARRHGRYVGR